MNIDEILNNSEEICFVQTKWSFKKYACKLSLYEFEDLEDLYFVFCSLLQMFGGQCSITILGEQLGFAMTNKINEKGEFIYKDKAEINLLNELLKTVEKEHLICVDNRKQIITLTSLGRLSLQNQKHYHFFYGNQDIYEHLNIKIEDNTLAEQYPFYTDLGVCTELHKGIAYWPQDDDIDDIINGEASIEVNQLNLLSKEKTHFFNVIKDKYFEIEKNKVYVRLVKYLGEYVPIIYNNENVAPIATEIINQPSNVLRKENIVLECLFQKLWEDENAILDYKSLEPFVELIDYEELTKDSRTVWTDKQLMNLIISNATPNCWNNISHHCNIDVLKTLIVSYNEQLNWGILTERIDDDYLISNFMIYPWDLEVLSNDDNRDISVIEKLLVQNKQTDDDWDWFELELKLRNDFVWDHLDVLKVDLSDFTKNEEKCRQAILKYPNKLWDWNKIERDFNLDFILDNISLIGVNFRFNNCLFDRIFNVKKYALEFVRNQAFLQVLKNACSSEGVLNSVTLNDKEYCWEPDVIDAFLELGLIDWESTRYAVGFECNENLQWNYMFFNKFGKYVKTEAGCKYVSSKIEDAKTIIENPNFSWNWDSLSSNKYLLKDEKFIFQFGSKLNWTYVLTYHPKFEDLQYYRELPEWIGDDENAWNTFTQKAKPSFITTHLTYNWNWTTATEKILTNQNAKSFQRIQYLDKLDWSVVVNSKFIDKTFIIDNLVKYKDYWNWESVFKKILNAETKMNENVLDLFAKVLSDIYSRQKCKDVWATLTKQYSFEELKQLLKNTISKKGYWWDLTYFSNDKEFDIFRDLKECRDFVDWDALSSSSFIDNSLLYTPKLKKTKEAWQKQVKELILDSDNYWNFMSLSHFESLYNQEWFLKQFKDKIDWEYITQHSSLFTTKDKQKLNEIISAFKSYILFPLLSEREDVDIEQILKIYPKADVNFNSMMRNGQLAVTELLIMTHIDYDWDWKLMSEQDSFYPSLKFLRNTIDKPYNWNALSKKDLPKIWADEDFISLIANNALLKGDIDWFVLSSRAYFPVTKDIIKKIVHLNLNWNNLSLRKNIFDVIELCEDKVNWHHISENKHLNIHDIEFLEQYKDKLNWNFICSKPKFKFTNNIIQQFADYINWDKVSAAEFEFTKEFIEKYKDKWNWSILVNNKAFFNKIDISELDIPIYGENIVNFITQFPAHIEPKAYHFTHMSNAVKIIKNMKLQSRCLADGNFENSAGSNVDRTHKAHHFARFYFRPKSPTQFYNECLGHDHKMNGRYYKKALDLGLPKCPMPVFFEFSIEEVLNLYPEICYYSTGNMQKDSTKSYKIIKDPSHINAKKIYSDNFKESFNERQQEFLVENELDLSKIQSLKISCYDEEQKRLLLKYVSDSPLASRIVVDEELYQRSNRELAFYEDDSCVEITTTYCETFNFRVCYTTEVMPTITNSEKVVAQKGNNIYLADTKKIEVQKNVPFEIYFEVSSPRVGSWLIYKNVL